MPRRLLLATIGLLGLVVAIAPASEAGDPPVNTISVTKVVDGDGPTGGYVIELTCRGFQAPDEVYTLTFDAAGPGNPETQVVDYGVIDRFCTLVELDDNGAETVTYDCTATVEQLEDSPDAAPGEGAETEGSADPGCVDDQTGQLRDYASADIDFTVTNTFATDVLPDDDEPDPPAVAPDVVSGSPTYTG